MATLRSGEAYGLFLLLTSTSKFATDLIGKIRTGGATLSSVNQYFRGALQASPFNLDINKIDITKFQKLWSNDDTNLTGSLDQTPLKVGKALTPPLPYDNPPCPDETTQAVLWDRLTHSF